MKKNFQFYLCLLLIPMLAVIFISSNWGKPYDALTGSPGDGTNTCAGCHSKNFDTNFNSNIQLSFSKENKSVSNYIPNTTYDLSLMVQSTSKKIGFQITAEDANKNKVGTWIAEENSSQLRIIDNAGLTHTITDTDGTWHFKWTAPSKNVGSITFYVICVISDNSGGTSGDEIKTEKFTLNQENITVYFKKPTHWNQVNLHYWRESPDVLPLSSYPGLKMNPTETPDWYSYTFENIASVNLLFSDNGDQTKKTKDLFMDKTSWYDNSWINEPENFLSTTTYENSKVSVFPNPAIENVTVNISPEIIDLQFKLYDFNGKQLLSKLLQSESTIINVSSLSKGTYIYNIEQNGQTIFSKKLVIK